MIRKHWPWLTATLAIFAAAALALALLTPLLAARKPPATFHLGTTGPPTPTLRPNLPAPSASASRPPLPDVSSPKVWASWALLKLDDGVLVTGGEPGQSTTESMIKVGIAADYLHGLEQPPRDPSEQEADDLGAMIRESDNDAAQRLYLRHGGDAVLQRLIATCNLHETVSKPGWWSETQMTAADAARLGGCIAQGKVASAGWAAWLLDRMREVTGVGRFGFVETHPVDRGRPLAIKNGWTLRPDGWHVSCLAIADWWTLAALVRYPAELGLVYGATVCADVAAALAPNANDETPRPPRTSAGAGASGGAE